jgi:hypothetical protein
LAADDAVSTEAGYFRRLRQREMGKPAHPLTRCRQSAGSFNMWKYYSETVDSLFRLDSQEWFLAMCAALIIGFFALRGFGSRSNY